MPFRAAALIRMFKLSGDSGDDIPADEKSSWSDEWKVLIYDAETRAIISPLLTVNDLRSLGVTLHLNIDAPRDLIPDVAALYFVRPTPMNVRYISDDAAAAKYREFHCNFVTPIPRPVLEAFACSCVEGACVPRIRKVMDQYLSFISLEARLFHLNMRDSYAAYARPDATEEDITSYARSICTSLVGVCASSGMLPIIVAQPGGPAQMVAQALAAAIKDHLSSPGSGVFGHAASGFAAASALPNGRTPVPLSLGPGGRPALLLIDRGIDLATPMAHTSSYVGLVDDTLGPLTLNRVVVPDSADESSVAGAGADAAGAGSNWLGELLGGTAGKTKAKGKPITLDSDADAFWRVHAIDEFPAAIDAHQKELEETLARETAIRRTAGASAGADDALAAAALGLGASAGADSSAADLISAIDSLPSLLKRRKVLEAHTTLLSGVMDRVGRRLIPDFYDVEAPGLFVGPSALDKNAIYDLLKNGDKGAVEDRARLACVYLLTCTPGAGASAGAASATAASQAGARGLTTDLKEEYDSLVSALTASVQRQAMSVQGAGANIAGQPVALPAAVQGQLDRGLAALRYCLNLRTALAMATMGGQGLGSGGPGSALFGIAAAAAGAVGGVTGSAGGRLLEAVARGTTTMLSKAASQVSRLMSGESHLPVTRAVSALADGKASGTGVPPGMDTFLVFDPRAPANAGAGNRHVSYASYLQSQQAAAQAALANGGMAPLSAGFRAVIPFVIGGGSYSEYVDCHRYAAAVNASQAMTAGTPQLTVIYGATEMLHPGGFLATLADLGRSLR